MRGPWHWRWWEWAAVSGGLAFLALAVWVSARVLNTIGAVDLGFHGWLAQTLGVVGALIVGCGLSAWFFYLARRQTAEEEAEAAREENDDNPPGGF